MLNKKNKVILILLTGIIMSGLFYGGLIYGKVTAEEKNKLLNPSSAVIDLEKSFNDVIEKVSPAVVNINTEKIIKTNNPFALPNEDFFQGTPFEEFFKFNQPFGPSEQKVSSLGSGVIVSSGGYILTNAHVIKEADKVNVMLHDGTQYKDVKIIGYDEAGDIAVLKVEAKKELPSAILGNSENLKVGNWVIAIGNPFGFNSSATSGIISAIHRSVPMGESNYGDMSDLIQTDASINPGNSGGPLVNLYGEVVGINTAIISPTGGSVGLGFSIPINNAKNIMDQIINYGKVTRGWLGVVLQELTPELSKNFGVETGVLISDIVPNGPASKAGIQPGDIVIKIDNKETKSPSELQKIISNKKPGDKVQLNIIRAKNNLTIDITIEGRPDNNLVVYNNQPVKNGTPSGEIKKWKGLTVHELTQEIKQKYKISDDYGVIVISVDPASRAYSSGIRGGEIIKKINDYVIKDINDYTQIINQVGDNTEAVVLLKVNQYSAFVVL